MNILRSLISLGILLALTCAVMGNDKVDLTGYKKFETTNAQFVQFLEKKFSFGVQYSGETILRGLNAANLSFVEKTNLIIKLAKALQKIQYPKTFPKGKSILANMSDNDYPMGRIVQSKDYTTVFLSKSVNWLQLILIFSSRPQEELNFQKNVDDYVAKLHGVQYQSLKSYTETNYKTLFSFFNKFCSAEDLEEYREEVKNTLLERGFTKKELPQVIAMFFEQFETQNATVQLEMVKKDKSSISMEFRIGQKESVEVTFDKPCSISGFQWILKASNGVVSKRVFLDGSMNLQKVVNNNVEKKTSEQVAKKQQELAKRTDRILVTVLDSGIDYNHKELAPYLLTHQLNEEEQIKYEEAKEFFVKKDEKKEEIEKRKRNQLLRTDYVLILEKNFAAEMNEVQTKLQLAKEKEKVLMKTIGEKKVELEKLYDEKSKIKKSLFQVLFSQEPVELNKVNLRIKEIEKSLGEDINYDLKRVQNDIPRLVERLEYVEKFKGNASQEERRKYDEALAQIEKDEKVIEEKLNDFIRGVTGWDFNDNDDQPYDYMMDSNSIAFQSFDHGTHVSGIIIANTDDISILPLRYGGGENDYEAIKLAYSKGSRVLNLSMGTSNKAKKDEDIDQENQKNLDSWKEFKEAAEEFSDMIFIVSAGNDGTDNDIRYHFPSNYNLPNIISVAATSKDHKLTDFSNYGDETVHLAAPGADVESLIVGGEKGEKSGTSMAAPYVTRVVALMRFINPDLSPEEIMDILEQTVSKTDELREKTIFKGYINPEKAFKATCQTIDTKRAQTLSYCQ